VAILMALLKGVNEGRFRLDQPVVIEEKYQQNNSGTFQHLSPGFTITLRDAAYMMSIVSDNNGPAPSMSRHGSFFYDLYVHPLSL
jgi:beta-lactamase class A